MRLDLITDEDFLKVVEINSSPDRLQEFAAELARITLKLPTKSAAILIIKAIASNPAWLAGFAFAMSLCKAADLKRQEYELGKMVE